jgi:uncharacterized protein (UPF0261 family)
MAEQAQTDAETILLIGTFDTKDDELSYMSNRIAGQGGRVLSMDVSVLGEPARHVDITKHQVADAAGTTIDAVIASGDENSAMQLMAKGAAALTARLHADGRFAGMLALGGTMGTDLALDCANALPMGVPKYIVSTVSFSPLIPAERLAPDIQMILWAGGLYGLNSVCKSSLSQAAGAVLGAARAVEPPSGTRPVVGITSLGKSCLSYMVTLKPELEKRGFEAAIFHSTGMGGRAFESIAGAGGFACVMDFCMQEFVNGICGSVVNSGPGRLRNAGNSATPQIVAPGASDIVDFPAWQEPPATLQGRPSHAHNRLIASAAITADERREIARRLAAHLATAKGPVHFILPLRGVEEWDKPGGDAHDPEGLAAFIDEARTAIRPPVVCSEIDAHINDGAFTAKALEVFDQWVADGTVKSRPD